MKNYMVNKVFARLCDRAGKVRAKRESEGATPVKSLAGRFYGSKSFYSPS